MSLPSHLFLPFGIARTPPFPFWRSSRQRDRGQSLDHSAQPEMSVVRERSSAAVGTALELRICLNCSTDYGTVIPPPALLGGSVECSILGKVAPFALHLQASLLIDTDNLEEHLQGLLVTGSHRVGGLLGMNKG